MLQFTMNDVPEYNVTVFPQSFDEIRISKTENSFFKKELIPQTKKSIIWVEFFHTT